MLIEVGDDMIRGRFLLQIDNGKPSQVKNKTLLQDLSLDEVKA